MARIYVGNLFDHCQEGEIEDKFSAYGRIVSFSLKKTRSGQPFAFIEYEDERDAQDAIKAEDSKEWMGRKLRVEVPFNCRPGGLRGPRQARSAPSKGEYRVIVSNLPPSGSWQDLKDMFREAGEVCYTETDQTRGTGVVEFKHRDDVRRAIKMFNNTKFKSHQGETSYIGVREDMEFRGGSRGYDRERYSRRDRYRDYSRGRDSPRYHSPRNQSPRYHSPNRYRSRSPRDDYRGGGERMSYGRDRGYSGSPYGGRY